ncbi:MAG TPA: hypothetical protein VGK37_16325 [Casimicrobiaceae bacterium]|jgi:hypothetical protein
MACARACVIGNVLQGKAPAGKSGGGRADLRAVANLDDILIPNRLKETDR